MGTRGPIPERAENRRRRNKTNTQSDTVFGEVEVPPADDNWHPIAFDWYTSLIKSGQSKYFEPSDWMAAQLLAHEMTRMLAARCSANMFAAVWSAMGDLLTTEGERRRARLEITRKTAAPAAPLAVVTSLDRYRDL